MDEARQLGELLLQGSCLWKQLHQELDGHGMQPPLSPTLRRLLMTLQTHPGENMRQISRHMGLDKSRVSRLADSLLALGLAERRNVGEDRRQKRLALTPEGEAYAAQVICRVNRELVLRLERLTPPQRARLLEMAGELRGLMEPLENR